MIAHPPLQSKRLWAIHSERLLWKVRAGMPVVVLQVVMRVVQRNA
jgi:hypothetical protein